MGCLYSLTFANGKQYIGITSKTLARRLVTHRNHANKGRDGAVHRAMRKYDFQFSAKVLVEADDWGYLCDLERKAIAAFVTMSPAGYNLTEGGEGTVGRKATVQQRARMSAAHMGVAPNHSGMLGRSHTHEARRKISEAGRRRVLSDESRAKIGDSKRGNTYRLGQTMSDESRRKSSETQRGVQKSETHRQNLSASHKGRPWSPARRAAHEQRGAQ